MIRIIKHSALLISLLSIFYQPIQAQKTKNYNGIDYWFVNLNGASNVGVTNVAFLDSLGSNNIIHSMAWFDVSFSKGENGSLIIELLAALKTNTANYTVELTRTIGNSIVEEKKLYTNSRVLEMQLPEFDGAANNLFATIRVKIQTTANYLQVSNPVGNEHISLLGGPKNKAVLTSNFNVDIAGLPDRRVTKISSVIIKTETAGNLQRGRPAYNGTLYIEVAEPDVNSWYDWFLHHNSGSDADKMDLRIKLLGADFKTAIGEITFYSTSILVASSIANSTKKSFEVKFQYISIRFF